MHMDMRKLTLSAATTIGALALGLAPPALASTRAPGASARAAHMRTAHDSGAVGTISFSQPVYQASENVGRFPVTVVRTNDSGPETFYYGVTNVSSSAGHNFDKVPKTQATFAPGQSTYTFYVPIIDQGINGPMRTARAFIYGGSPAPVSSGTTDNATIDLLQDDPLQAKDPANPLGYPQAPTDGDPLQFVKWYIYGDQSPAGKHIRAYGHSNPSWAAALHKIAYSPGSGTYRFWMWNQPASSLAMTVEKFLADAELKQPGTTVALSTYSLVHGACESPAAIQSRYEDWITQLAKGIGNFRVVLYLEEDSLIETHCLTKPQIAIRLQELSYAVNALSQDPHVLVYMDAGAPDAWLNARKTAAYLKKADIAQAQGFFLNSTHNDWTTANIHYGQEISRLVGGKHFIIQTDDNGRGPLVPKDRKHKGNEDLCNPPGRGTGPLSWDTGYEAVDGFLWFNNPGNSDGPCGVGDPPVADFWAEYAVGLVQRGTNKVTGPHYHLIKSQTNM